VGAGGIGEVHLAQDTKLDRKVALKILLRRSDAETVIRELEGRYANNIADGRDLAVVYAGLERTKVSPGWRKPFNTTVSSLRI
jgi:hypothetical protein